MTDNHGYVLSPLPVAPVNETDMLLRPEGLKALKRVAKTVGLDLRGAYLNLDAGFDSTHNRKCMFKAGMIPNITENPRHRQPELQEVTLRFCVQRCKCLFSSRPGAKGGVASRASSRRPRCRVLRDIPVARATKV